MTEEMRKRLEEAANNFVGYVFSPNERPEISSVRTAFWAGAEWMFKEAGGEIVFREMRRIIIHQAKEWLKEHFFYKHHLAEYYWESKCDDMEEALADFESDMTKLWEGEK